MKAHLCWSVSNELSDHDRWRLKQAWRARMNYESAEPSIEEMARELAIERGILKEGERL